MKRALMMSISGNLEAKYILGRRDNLFEWFSVRGFPWHKVLTAALQLVPLL